MNLDEPCYCEHTKFEYTFKNETLACALYYVTVSEEKKADIKQNLLANPAQLSLSRFIKVQSPAKALQQYLLEKRTDPAFWKGFTEDGPEIRAVAGEYALFDKVERAVSEQIRETERAVHKGLRYDDAGNVYYWGRCDENNAGCTLLQQNVTSGGALSGMWRISKAPAV